MYRAPFALFVVLLLTCSLPSRAADYPRVVFPAGHVLPAVGDATADVDVALLQVELRPGLILSATRGTRFALASRSDNSPDQELRIDGSPLTIIDLPSNSVVIVPPGRYRLALAPGVSSPLVAPPPTSDVSPDALDTSALSPGYRLSDAIMTQQQKYLDSLKIDVRDINNFLASIIRSLVPRRP